MRIPLVDLRRQYQNIKPEVDEAIRRVVESGQYILGAEVAAFEREMAEYVGTKYAVAVASGTDALYLALRACDVGAGDEVITTPFTFIATSEAIVKCGARPVFVDIEPRTFNIDVTRIDKAITEKTAAILPVHLFGHPADVRYIPDLGTRGYILPVIEDCAQALGAEVGSSTAGCLSFFPSKNLGAFGDGGMVVTNDTGIEQTVELLRNHGACQSYHHVEHGINSRLDALQAAILRVKLNYLDAWNEARREHAALYNRLLGNVDGITVPYVEEWVTPSWNYYTIRVDERIGRDRVRQYLADKDIASAVYYPIPLHLQPVYKELGYKCGDFPVAEKASREVLSLPMYPELNDSEIVEVCEEIRKCVSA